MIGVLGGMGPLASAEFLRTIYEEEAGEREQHAPQLILYSDPTVPDRTEGIRNGRDDALEKRLVDALRWFEAQRVTSVVICCVTIHYLLPRLPASLRSRVMSLVDVILEAVLEQRRPHLLLCTEGTRASRVFDGHPLWERARRWVIMPSDSDQRAVHDLIYRLKRNQPLDETRPRFDALLSKYDAGAFIAGCTELHILIKRIHERDGRLPWDCVDPLTIVARRIMQSGRLAMDVRGADRSGGDPCRLV
jgi:aspartate racemase